jgi:phosphoribosylanthranilate isomerase
MHIKICGITSIEDALAAIDAGADMLGFNFYPRSPRYITAERCAAITPALQGRPVTLVGLFVNSSPDEILATMEVCGLDLAQLHGDEPVEALAVLGGKAFKAFRKIPESSLLEYTKYSCAKPALLLDANVAGA